MKLDHHTEEEEEEEEEEEVAITEFRRHGITLSPDHINSYRIS